MKLKFMKCYIVIDKLKIDLIDCYYKDLLFATIAKSQSMYTIKSKYIKDEYDKNGMPIYNKRSKDLESLKNYCDEKLNEWLLEE